MMNYGFNNGLNNFGINKMTQLKNQMENLFQEYQNTIALTQPQQQAPVQNIINTSNNNDTLDFEARFLQDEDVSNVIVQRKTLFVDENNKKIFIKEKDGNISKTYEIVVPKDKKDLKIEELENKLKEMEITINELRYKNDNIIGKTNIESKGQSSSNIKSNRNKSAESI